MALSMSQRRTVTRTTALSHACMRARTGHKRTILDELCALTLWHRDHTRKALSLDPPTCSWLWMILGIAGGFYVCARGGLRLSYR